MTIEARELRGAEYPARLRDLPTPPERVWVVGELPRGLTVAIVGTRRPTEDGRRFARTLASDLAREGIAILSGGAIGIDTAAHEGALDAAGTTVVVAPSSFDRPYPRTNRALFERIVRQGGAFITRYQADAPPLRYRFPQRNAMLAALAHAVIVVETGVKGGSRMAAGSARRLGRPLLVVPGAPWNPVGLGCVVELRLGATAVGSFRDVLEALDRPAATSLLDGLPPVLHQAQVPESTSDSPAWPELARVRHALLKCPSDVDALSEQTGIPVGRLRGLLLTLTLEGVLVSTPAGQLSLLT